MTDRPATASDPARATNSAADEFDALMRDGYVVVKGGIRPELVDAANADLDQFKKRNRRAVGSNVDDAGRLSRVVNLHLLIDSFATIFSDTSALKVCDRFFGEDAVLYTTLLFERGSEQRLHRDAPVFVTRPPGKYLGVWAALDDVDDDNGPLIVVPGSHNLPALDVVAMARALYGDPAKAPEYDDPGWDEYQTAVKEQADANGLTPIEAHVSKGDVIVWHPLLLHGGAPHRSVRRTRRSLVMHVTPINTPVYHQDVFFNPSKDVPDTAPGSYFDHHGRKLGKSDYVDFAHKYSRPVRLLNRPGAGLDERLGVAARRMKGQLRRLRKN